MLYEKLKQKDVDSLVSEIYQFIVFQKIDHIDNFKYYFNSFSERDYVYNYNKEAELTPSFMSEKVDEENSHYQKLTKYFYEGFKQS